MNGATGGGIHLGTIQIGNGSATAMVDLSKADNLGDVVSLINNSAWQMSPPVYPRRAWCSRERWGRRHSEGSGWRKHRERSGILSPTSGGANTPLVGASVNLQVTNFITLSQLRNGAGIDNTGFTITNGAKSATIDITAGMNVEGLLNEINGAGLGVNASINKDGSGIDLQNTMQGTAMTISGKRWNHRFRSWPSQQYAVPHCSAVLNDGVGVRTTADGSPDFDITTADGTKVTVAITGAATMQDVIDKINAAGGTALTASFATTGNGIVLKDNTTGSSTFSVQAINASSAATDLGLDQPANRQHDCWKRHQRNCHRRCVYAFATTKCRASGK